MNENPFASDQASASAGHSAATEAASLMDASISREVEEAMAQMSADDLADLSQSTTASVAEGGSPVRRGMVVGIHGDDVFIDLGEKHQAVAPLSQFGGKKTHISIGQAVEVVVDRLDTESGLLLCSREGAIRPATWETLAIGTVVEGRVTGMNKGGLELILKGIHGFMPASQVADHHVKDISCFIGQVLRCEVVAINKRDKTVTLSHRKVEERERAEAREKLLQELAVGQIRQGVVRSIVEYGAFVDIGGVDGLAHISDLSYTQVEKVSDVLTVGQTIDVKVLKIDRERDRISLSIKQAQPDPWTKAEEKFAPGAQVQARVLRIADFGAFAALGDGIEGLIPVSEMAWTRIANPSSVVQVGDTVNAVILRVEPQKRRIALSMKQAQPDPWSGVFETFQENAVVPGKITRLTDFGAFIELVPGVEGLAHISELSDRRIRQPGEVVQSGQEVQVRVLKVDPQQRRISLSLKLVADRGVEYTPETAAESAAKAASKKKRAKPLRGGLESNWDWTGAGILPP